MENLMKITSAPGVLGVMNFAGESTALLDYQECRDACPVTDTYRGFFFDDDFEEPHSCFCYYDNGTSPTPTGSFSDSHVGGGTGPIFRTDETTGSVPCHKYHPGDSTISCEVTTAVFDDSYGAPRCESASQACDTGYLVVGMGYVSIDPYNNTEPNVPNTIDGCEDGSGGSHLVDESIEGIIVKSVGCGELRAGELATIVATVFVYNTNNKADFYYSLDVSNPDWVYIGTVNATNEDELEDLEMTYTIPVGSDIQAVRVQFQTDGNPLPDQPCRSGSYDERDDIVFKVLPAFPTPSPTENPTGPTPAPVCYSTTIVTSWTSADIGQPEVEGRSSWECDTVEVTGAGEDIWYDDDEFHYIYTSMPGGSSVSVEMYVLGLSGYNLDGWTKGGLMIRDSLDAGSKHISLFVTKSNGLANQGRHNDGMSSNNFINDETLPTDSVWLKITKTDKVFQTYYRIENDPNWTAFGGPQDLFFWSSDTFYVGIAVTSHDKDMVATLKAMAVSYQQIV
eukprot:scaffold49246_cov37-Cyclotella_meneghiniana.AAC.3